MDKTKQQDRRYTIKPSLMSRLVAAIHKSNAKTGRLDNVSTFINYFFDKTLPPK